MIYKLWYSHAANVKGSMLQYTSVVLLFSWHCHLELFYQNMRKHSWHFLLFSLPKFGTFWLYVFIQYTSAEVHNTKKFTKSEQTGYIFHQDLNLWKEKKSIWFSVVHTRIHITVCNHWSLLRIALYCTVF